MEKDLLTRCQGTLEEERPLRGLDFLPEERTLLSGFAFLSEKPLLVVYNSGEAALQEPLPDDVAEYARAENLTVVPVCGKLEMEIAQLDPGERAEFLSELGLSETARDRFIRHAYDHLRLMSFFTAGPVEVRAWTIARDTAAVQRRRQDPLRHRARLHPRRGHLLRRLHRAPGRIRLPLRRQAAPRRQRVPGAGRRRHAHPVQRVTQSTARRFPVNRYSILQHPTLGLEAVKNGWSWPAFLFTWIWAFVKRLFLIGWLVLLLVMVLSSIPSPEVWLVGNLIISIAMGAKGNELRVKRLRGPRIRRGGDRGGEDAGRCAGGASCVAGG